ncbi:AAA family ATPase [Cytophagaceae bacterium DM2B3-1]|uniref:AAA family ATPase n=1 Tax=Xanthocytophaga flava TaxID=3048013 RepID=A0ABT7CDB8_9BACT|nr:AAA family ATPase [Xanthocytophaga flavus]MDJ1491671.1 AAA family ATPase [Xanthocytophaga flavus]
MIYRIGIENFKSIQKANISLLPINILIGANGAGKSNFISFFKLLNQIYEQNLQTYIAQNGRADNFLYFGRKKSHSLKGLITFTNNIGNIVNRYGFVLTPNTENNFFFQLEKKGFNKGNNKNENWHDNDIATASLESTLKKDKTYISVFVQSHLASFRVYHFHDTSASASVKQFSRLNDNESLRDNGSNLAAFLYRLKEKNPSSYQLIEATIKSIAPFFKAFDLTPSRLNEDSIELKWIEEGSDMYLNAHNLSDGTLRMICLATLLLQPDLPKTIIIDEPELGLHPVAINKLAGLLKKAAEKGSQIIVSTQSVGLIDNFDPEDIIVTDRENQQSVFKRLSTEELKDWLDDYSLGELWNKNIIGGRP